VRPPDPIHPIDPGALGEYAAVVQSGAEATAAELFPEVAAHLNSPCVSCRQDLMALVTMVAAELRAGSSQPRSGPPGMPRGPAGELASGAAGAAASLELPGGRQFVLDKSPVSLGRDPSNDLVLHEPTVSGVHARLERQGGTWLITDLHSSNGVRVNGERVQERALEDGDVVELGRQRLCFRAD
jgi:hypothetical protein